ncbi:MAG: copper resistance protein, partial [Acetobacteraceae bacterium]|nr:copper resistance protein [Acetobacteraceae bacterium]
MMVLLIDLFGYLSIVLHGLTILAQSVSLGGVLFLVLLARPFAPRLGEPGRLILRGTTRAAFWSAIALIACEAATIALQSAVLVGTVDLSLASALGANFAIAGMVKIAAAALVAVLLFARAGEAPSIPLLALAAVQLAAATLTTHAAARLDDRLPLLIVEFLHQLGAAIWIGGIPCFV